ncbi:hypothetical protein FQA39_LY04244 [Lamprigera yunnana]|nr:hypothetical protein FQA39_LY04244 [Lamprigera yunnana]
MFTLLFKLFFLGTSLACSNIKWNIFDRNQEHLAALILARGGSRGIPLKNLAQIQNVTLLTRSINTIVKFGQFDSIWVSTENDLILDESSKHSINIHWRSYETATDEASSLSAVQEFLEKHPQVNRVALIQCTSPFLKVRYLEEALGKLRSGLDCVFSVTSTHKLQWTKFGDRVVPNFDIRNRPRRQDFKNVYVENGMFYFTSRSLIRQGYFQSNRNIFDRNQEHLAALILARGGSRGIPLKNLAQIQNVTLLTRSINTIVKFGQFDSIWVSTENDLILDESSKHSINIHWRSYETATDEASSLSAVQEFLEKHPQVNRVALIQCTSPFLKVRYLEEALGKLRSGLDCVFSVTSTHKLQWTKFGDRVVPNFDIRNRPRRQDFKNVYMENGMFYFTSRSLIRQGYFQSNRAGNDVLCVELRSFVKFGSSMLCVRFAFLVQLSGGKIPSFYREVFDMCSSNGDPISRDIFKDVLACGKLDSATLKIIWDLTVSAQESITRTNLYKALSLIGWAQEGKSPSNKLFDNFTGKEYPTPNLEDLAHLIKSKVQKKIQTNLSRLGLSYSDIKQLDTINVELIPEKKGIIIKYSEYIVSSRRFNSKVTRRYNDFFALYELLLNRFPYRMVPRLPPKKLLVLDSHFLELRRKALQRWLTLVSRHPTISNDALVSFFLTDFEPECQYRIRDIFRQIPDEFMTSDLAATAKDLLPNDCSEFANNREQVRLLMQVISRLKQLIDAEIVRTQAHARDSEDFANQLKTLANINPEQLTTGHWKHMQRGFSSLAQDILAIPNKLSYHASFEQISVCERLGLLLDVLIAHRDLCDRLEKGLAHDHQAALAKMLSLKKRRIQGVIRGTDSESVEQLEARMLAQENIITNMELRSDFSLYCVHMETQLVHSYLETLSPIFNNFVCLHRRAHLELTDLWNGVCPTVEKYFCTDENDLNNGKFS